MEHHKEDKTRRLLRELDVIERKSEAMKKETERLRNMKNQALQSLTGKYPDLFRHSRTRADNNLALDSISKYLFLILNF